MRAHPLASVGLVVLALAARAQAQSAPPEVPPGAESPDPEREREARALFTLAHAHYDAGQYERAAQELEEAYRLSPRAVILLDVHLAYRELGDTARSADALRRYLAAANDLATAERTRLERRLAALEGTLAQQAPTSADPPTEPEPARDTSALAFEDAGFSPDAPAPVDGTPHGAIVAFSAAGAGLVLTAITGPLALTSREALTCAPRCTDAEVDTVRTLAIVADVGLGIAAVGAVVGTILLLTGSAAADAPDEGSAAHATAVLAPTAGGALVIVGGSL